MKTAKKLNVHQAKTHLSAVLGEIEKEGATFLICRNGRPIADLVPHARVDRLAPHPTMRRIGIKYDPTEDLAPDEWPVES